MTDETSYPEPLEEPSVDMLDMPALSWLKASDGKTVECTRHDGEEYRRFEVTVEEL